MELALNAYTNCVPTRPTGEKEGINDLIKRKCDRETREKEIHKRAAETKSSEGHQACKIEC